MKWVPLILVMCVGFMGASCRQQDVRTTTIRCPRVGNPSSVKLVSAALAKVDGVMPTSIRCNAGTVTVTYDSMKVAIKNLELAIAETGFDAGEFPADEKARTALPADCK